ncbi:unnamed protein product [Amoebophrya sp. A25]|nr:unnamed protein product [Amoebophrya sp. A25]|eukprot:GSA25T00003112001.1
MLYVPVFGYGSNSIEQVSQRVGADVSARCVRGILHHYQRRFVGFSKRWNGSVATVVKESRPESLCRGTLVFLTKEEVCRLDRWETVNPENPKDSAAAWIYRRVLAEVEVMGIPQQETQTLLDTLVCSRDAIDWAVLRESEGGENMVDAAAGQLQDQSTGTSGRLLLPCTIYVKNGDESEGEPSVDYLTAVAHNLSLFFSQEDIAEELGESLLKKVTTFSQACIRA